MVTNRKLAVSLCYDGRLSRDTTLKDGSTRRRALDIFSFASPEGDRQLQISIGLLEMPKWHIPNWSFNLLNSQMLSAGFSLNDILERSVDGWGDFDMNDVARPADRTARLIQTAFDAALSWPTIEGVSGWAPATVELAGVRKGSPIWPFGPMEAGRDKAMFYLFDGL